MIHKTVRKHIETFFSEHEIDFFNWDSKPLNTSLPDFYVARIAPGPRIDLWVYISVGSSVSSHSDAARLEFILLCRDETPRAVELLGMVAHRHTSDPFR